MSALSGANDINNFSVLEKKIREALAELKRKDAHLLEVDSSERSISHALAVRIWEKISLLGYNVDCEYNRDRDDVKRLKLSIVQTNSDDFEAKTVFPDIIIHRRGTNDYNLLVIEMKKYGGNTKYDAEKIQAYIDELGYKFGLLLECPKDGKGEFSLKWRTKESVVIKKI